MKKIFLASAIVLSLSAMAPVFAADTTITGTANGTKEGSMEITYGVTSGYTVTIPADLNLEGTTAAKRTISADNVKIPYGTSLKVKISSENYEGSKWYLVDEASDGENRVEYTIKDEDDEVVEIDDIVLEVKAGDLEGDNDLTFQVPEVPTKAGEYLDTLSFTVEVTDYEAIRLD